MRSPSAPVFTGSILARVGVLALFAVSALSLLACNDDGGGAEQGTGETAGDGDGTRRPVTATRPEMETETETVTAT